jgi:hypothetical protein
MAFTLNDTLSQDSSCIASSRSKHFQQRGKNREKSGFSVSSTATGAMLPVSNLCFS